MTPLVEAQGLELPGMLSPTDFTSTGGEMVALVGPNGGGKTSLLRALARAEGTQGQVLVDGEPLDELTEAGRRRLIGFLPASREISWPIPVPDVIALGLGRPDQERVEELIQTFELEPFRARAIGNLSTGERARVLLARAMAARSRLLLLDEPLSNLDPYWVLRTLELLRDAVRTGATVMVAMHDLAQIERFHRLLLVTGGQITGDGKPAVLSGQTGQLFGVEATPRGGWRISRPPEGPRSLP